MLVSLTLYSFSSSTIGSGSANPSSHDTLLRSSSINGEPLRLRFVGLFVVAIAAVVLGFFFEARFAAERICFAVFSSGKSFWIVSRLDDAIASILLIQRLLAEGLKSQAKYKNANT